MGRMEIPKTFDCVIQIYFYTPQLNLDGMKLKSYVTCATIVVNRKTHRSDRTLS